MRISSTYSRLSTTYSIYQRLMPVCVVAGCMLFLLYKYVLQISPSVMVHPLMRSFHLNGLGIGALTASWFWSMLIVQFAAGPLLDRYSAKWVSPLAIIASAAGALWFSQSHDLQHAIWARSLMGAGAAFATVSYLKLSADWFSGRAYGVVCGLLVTGGMIGSMMAQAPLALIVTHHSWQTALRDCAYLGLMVAIIYWILIPSKKGPYLEASQTQPIRLNDCLTILTSKTNWWLMLYSGLAFTPLAVFGGLWGNVCLERIHGMSSITASMMSSSLFLGLAIGGPFFGWIADRWISRKSSMYFGLVLSLFGFCGAIYLPIHASWFIAMEVFIAGFGTGAFMLGFGVGKDSNCLTLAATVVCMINTGDSILGALTEPLIGKILDLTGHPYLSQGAEIFSRQGYFVAMGVLMFFIVLAACCLIGVKDSHSETIIQ